VTHGTAKNNFIIWLSAIELDNVVDFYSIKQFPVLTPAHEKIFKNHKKETTSSPQFAEYDVVL